MATLISRSRNSYITFPRRVTMTPRSMSLRTLKFAMDFFAFVRTGLRPVICVISCGRRIQELLVHDGLAEARAHHDLRQPRDLHHALVAELVLQVLRHRLQVQGLQPRLVAGGILDDGAFALASSASPPLPPRCPADLLALAGPSPLGAFCCPSAPSRPSPAFSAFVAAFGASALGGLGVIRRGGLRASPGAFGLLVSLLTGPLRTCGTPASSRLPRRRSRCGSGRISCTRS